MSKRKLDDETNDDSGELSNNALEKLLMFDPTKMTLAEIRARFTKIAAALLNRAVIVANGTRCRLAEIEFYLNGGPHLDIFTHGSQMQKDTSAQWYFHTMGGGSYKGGTYKGLDISMGKPGCGAGGILLRSIEVLEGKNKGKLHQGSCLLVDLFLKTSSVSSIDALVAMKAAKKPKTGAAKANSSSKRSRGFQLPILADIPDESVLYVEVDNSLPKREIYQSPRVGLTLKGENTPERVKYIMQPYRYLTLPKEIKKGKATMALAMHIDGKSASSIKALTGALKIEDYIRAFQKGKTHGNVSKFVGLKFKVAELCELYGAVQVQNAKSKAS